VGQYGPRTSATDREVAAARYIAAELARAGFSASLQEFPVHVTPGHGRDLQITTPRPLKVETVAMAGSGEGTVTGRLVHVGLGRPEDIPSGGLAGAIALARRGLIPFGEKAENVRQAGGAGLVVFNSEQGLFGGNLGGQAAIPVVSISDADGQTLLGLIEAGPVTASLTLRSEDRTSRNVVAVVNKGQGPVVVLGGHYDSVPESLGANDNASGTSVLLALAGEIARKEWPFEVRIIAFGSEELGLLGSSHYVDSLPPAERARIAAMLNFDALGTGVLEATGDRSLLDAALSIARELGIPLVDTGEPPNASSDHASFRAAGVPVLFIAATDFSRIHTADDTIEHVDRALLGQAAAIGIRALERLAAAGRP
jgi:aminopeptidase YwaD